MTRSPAFCSVRGMRRWRRGFAFPYGEAGWSASFARRPFHHSTVGFISHVRRPQRSPERCLRPAAPARCAERGRCRERDGEIRVALLEADVALPVVRDFVNSVREKAIGQEVLRSVTPGQMVVKVVHDHLVEVLGGEAAAGGQRGDGIDLNQPPQSGSCWWVCKARARRRPAPDCAAAEEPRAQEGADGLARRAAPGGAGAIGPARPPDRRHDIAGRAGAAPGRDHPARAGGRPARGLRRRDARHRRKAPYQ